MGDAKGASPLSSDTRGDPAEGGADVSALGFMSQRKREAQARARFGRGDQCSARPRTEHSLFRSEMKPAGCGGAARMRVTCPTSFFSSLFFKLLGFPGAVAEEDCEDEGEEAGDDAEDDERVVESLNLRLRLNVLNDG